MVLGDGPVHQLTLTRPPHDSEFGVGFTCVSSRAQVCKAAGQAIIRPSDMSEARAPGQRMLWNHIKRLCRIQNGGSLW